MCVSGITAVGGARSVCRVTMWEWMRRTVRLRAWTTTCANVLGVLIA